MKLIVIVQARLTSTRFPKKVLQTVGGKSLIARVCEAARDANIGRVVVAWAHKFPNLEEGDVLSRFQQIVLKYQPDFVVRLTSDCPLLRADHITQAVDAFFSSEDPYYYNGVDGYDVQVFESALLFNKDATDKEHVIKQTTLAPHNLSVDTPEDLEKVRKFYSQSC